MSRLANAIGFQIGWWACVYGVRHELEIEAIVLCLFWISVQMYLSKDLKHDIWLGAMALIIGISMDSLLQYFSIIEFYGWSVGPLSPFWLWVLWLLFALTLNSSLEFLKNLSPISISLLGLVLGPLTYVMGAQIGAAQFRGTPIQIATLGLSWMIALPLLISIATRSTDTVKD